MRNDIHAPTTPVEAVSLRIIVAQTAKRGPCPLYEAIVAEARKRGLAGATAVRGVMGLDAAGNVHARKILPIGENMPVVVEIVDEADKIEAFLPFFDGLGQDVTVLVRRVRAIRFGTAPAKP